MYEQFYGFSGSPFRLTPDHRFYFHSEGHRKAMSYLKYGLYQGEGFIVISGEVGLGKSTLVAQLFEELDPNDVVAAQMGVTQVDGDDALRLICDAFEIQSAGRAKGDLIAAFQRFLIAQRRAGRRALLVVDEAQNLPVDTLEELRMLSNFAESGQPLLQGFLLGQPPFLETLARPDLAQLQQRVIASYRLQPMAESETEQYVRHRLEMVGWRDHPVLTSGAFSAIHRETEGVPRRINTLCNRILLYGALEELDEVDVRVVDSVIEDLLTEAVQPLAKPAPVAPTVSAAPWRDAPSPPAARARASAADAAGAAPTAAEAGGGREALNARVEQLEARQKEHDAALRELIDVALSQASDGEAPDGGAPEVAATDASSPAARRARPAPDPDPDDTPPPAASRSRRPAPAPNRPAPGRPAPEPRTVEPPGAAPRRPAAAQPAPPEIDPWGEDPWAMDPDADDGFGGYEPAAPPAASRARNGAGPARRSESVTRDPAIDPWADREAAPSRRPDPDPRPPRPGGPTGSPSGSRRIRRP